MAAPTLINLPPPPSDPVTPSEFGPGTPNSATTSLSALSTTAIKDGHRGHLPHPHSHHHASTASVSSNSSSNTLDAERADRISRLAGLERVATLRAPSTQSQQQQQGLSPSAFGGVTGGQPGAGYFDSATTSQTFVPGDQTIPKDRSTVGSASATNSVTGGPSAAGTWTTTGTGTTHSVGGGADGGMYDTMDKMSMSGEDVNDGVSSAGLSDEGNASLVGFGETAGSTVSGPISTRTGPTGSSSAHPPSGSGLSRVGSYADAMQGVQQSGLDGSASSGQADGAAGMTGVETAERIVGDRFRGQTITGKQLQGDGKGLGKFAFEEK